MIKSKGRPKKINVDLLLMCFKKYKDDIVNGNQICSKDDKIWLTISKEMNETISSLSLYTYACNNIYGVKDILIKKKFSLTPEISSDRSYELSTNLSECSITDNETDTFEIVVSKQEFDSIIEERLLKRSGRNKNKKTSYRKTLKFRSGLYQEFFAKIFWKTRRLRSYAINYINHYIPYNINRGYINMVQL